MITRILLGVDMMPGSAAARDMALDLAAAHGASVEAVAVIDTPWITRPMAVGIGGAAYRVSEEIAELRRAHAEADAALQAFRMAAGSRSVACEGHVGEGSPPDVLAEASVASDVMALGYDATFWGKEAGPTAPAVRGVLAQNPRPVLVVPSAPVAGDRVLVAFDGSQPASRTLHLAALLGISARRPVVVLSVATEQPLAAVRATNAAQLLRAHGSAVEDVLAIASETDPAEIILNHVQSLHVGLVVMGAYGHTGLREMLFGSCTRKLLLSCPGAMFVHH